MEEVGSRRDSALVYTYRKQEPSISKKGAQTGSLLGLSPVWSSCLVPFLPYLSLLTWGAFHYVMVREPKDSNGVGWPGMVLSI